MIKTDELKGIIVKNKKSQKDIANMLNITPTTFYRKMAKGVFGSDEIEIMINELNIKDPIDIFFAKRVT